MLVDCHTHIDSFSNQEISQILTRARKAGVGCVVSAGTTVESSARSVALSKRFPGIFCGIGIHPMNLLGEFDKANYTNLWNLAQSTDMVLVVSEIGLDFMDGTPERAIQYQAFRAQIRLAKELSLPIIFHSRDAHDETLRLLREEKAYEVGGAMHYFHADRETALRVIDLGFNISLARPLLRLAHLQRVVANLPLDSIVLESDSAPQPFKAKRENWTEPRHVRAIAEKIAELQNVTVEEVEVTTSLNFAKMLGPRSQFFYRHIEGTSTS